ncbi:hypothetical protein [Polaribacter glomeratus]|uniref:Uncharacterized protein n=1 Tax=Polaribacter glomeratus TaxID=102 RepID=A0A2S7WZJ8_9FLAO|nr:hypothetical protein [Polaribacter glomeratus]PQJ82792.1 hypothetical protein BTO16_09465 [Polaribacter glomeratus]TXD65333.1 hypothetical protein ESX12_10945 [Polaribacter glomeratus]
MKRKISIRISDSLSDKLSEISEMKNISVSELSRTILEQHFAAPENSEKEGVTNHFNNQITESESKVGTLISYGEFEDNNIDVVHSIEFFKLIIWMYDQRDTRLLKFGKVELVELKNTILKVYFSDLMLQELKDEFNKVFVDLIKEIQSDYSTTYRLNFAMYYSGGFDFSLLTKFIFKEDLGSKSITI